MIIYSGANQGVKKEIDLLLAEPANYVNALNLFSFFWLQNMKIKQLLPTLVAYNSRKVATRQR